MSEVAFDVSSRVLPAPWKVQALCHRCGSVT